MSFTRFVSEEKSILRLCFQTLLHQTYYVRLWQTAYFDYSWRVKVKIFVHFRTIKDRNPNFKDFPGPRIFFCQFQDFPGFSRAVATVVKWVTDDVTKPVRTRRESSWKEERENFVEKVLVDIWSIWTKNWSTFGRYEQRAGRHLVDMNKELVDICWRRLKLELFLMMRVSFVIHNMVPTPGN